MDILFWVKLGLCAFFLGFLLTGFVRGLSLRPTPPESRAPERTPGAGL